MGRYRRAAHAGLRCFFDSVRFLSSRRLFSSFYSGSRFCDCGFGFCRMGGFFTFWLVDVREKRAVVRLRGGRIRFWSCGFSCNRFAAILRSVIGGGCVDLCLYRLLGLNNGGFFVIGLFFQRCCAFFLRLRIGCLCNGFWGYIVVRPVIHGQSGFNPIQKDCWFDLNAFEVGENIFGSSSKSSVAKPNETKMFRSVFPYSLKKCCFFALILV